MSCDAVEWIEYKGVKLFKFPGSEAYFYTTKRMAIDADGAPNAYRADDGGIDALANAGYPNQSWHNVIVSDPSNNNIPYVQTSGEYKGYFVSKTTLQDSTLPVTDYRRYVDSNKIPYMVFPGAFYKLKGTGNFGDIAAAYNLKNDKKSAVIVADAGATNHELGEVSIKLAENLGGQNINPRNGKGMPGGTFVYIVFPKSLFTPKWRVTTQQIEDKSNLLLAEIGGWERILKCVGR